MRAKGLKAREAVLHAASELLEQGEITDLQIREVAKLAGVSLGAPNYYFGSKENLIKEAIADRTQNLLDRWIEVRGSLTISPEQKLRLISKGVGRYYAAHPKICRIRLNNDLFLGHKDELRRRFHAEILLPVSQELSPHKSEEERKLIISVVGDCFDLTFLRVMSGSHDSGLDYFDEENRNKYIDKLVDLAIALLKS